MWLFVMCEIVSTRHAASIDTLQQLRWVIAYTNIHMLHPFLVLCLQIIVGIYLCCSIPGTSWFRFRFHEKEKFWFRFGFQQEIHWFHSNSSQALTPDSDSSLLKQWSNNSNCDPKFSEVYISCLFAKPGVWVHLRPAINVGFQLILNI